MDSAYTNKFNLSEDAQDAPGEVIEPDMVSTQEGSGLLSRKFIVSMTLIVISSIFTGMGLMTIEQWLWFTGAISAGYLGINLAQKKL